MEAATVYLTVVVFGMRRKLRRTGKNGMVAVRALNQRGGKSGADSRHKMNTKLIDMVIPAIASITRSFG